ncbi:MAG: hypothetical protein KME07_10275 [Pegethrix bostrychoides GSE-TBD4-15B]|uniref:Uncharacterized protein n=1 Tax=Pegethrix bostrychoides GSE-TBD4-15B TaxID=2839662 RepID=A0A951U4K1_9CYAN|nr:hypothetical protein [Pegethrix bostrychoides GSE-TBD4-15B]
MACSRRVCPVEILGASREQVLHTINEFYVKRVATDRSQFSPMIPAPLVPGKYMTLLMR